jgi:isocitrate/isopropylmalate dehydrogenase
LLCRSALLPEARGRYEDIDVVLVRENLEGLYVGFEHYIPIGDDPHAVAIGSGVNTRAGCRRIAEFAFEYAVRNNRKKVTTVHKAIQINPRPTSGNLRWSSSCNESFGPDNPGERAEI